jgi:hypothetical protein
VRAKFHTPALSARVPAADYCHCDAYDGGSCKITSGAGKKVVTLPPRVKDCRVKSLWFLPPSFDAHCAHSLREVSHYVQSSGNAGAGKNDVFVHTKITSFPAPTMKIVMGTLGNAVLQ